MTVMFNTLPATLADFAALPGQDPSRPENTCALFICALHLFAKDKDAGVKAINMLKGPQPLSNHDISFLSDRISDKHYLPMVYFEGATPENSYTPAPPYTVQLHSDPRPQDCGEGLHEALL